MLERGNSSEVYFVKVNHSSQTLKLLDIYINLKNKKAGCPWEYSVGLNTKEMIVTWKHIAGNPPSFCC